MTDSNEPEEEIRQDRVEEAKWKIRTGYYDLEDPLEDLVERLLRALKKEP